MCTTLLLSFESLVTTATPQNEIQYARPCKLIQSTLNSSFYGIQLEQRASADNEQNKSSVPVGWKSIRRLNWFQLKRVSEK